jgi:stage II sporulation protein D (peptidoglycan lytic transglycosylase)
MMKTLLNLTALFVCLLLFTGPASASEKVRVLVLDDLPGVTLDFPPEYNVEGLSNLGISSPDGQGGTRMVLEGDRCPKGGVRINAEGITIKVNQYALSGVVEIKRNVRGRYRIINELGLEDYTRSVVGEEMGPNWPIEALKAQAVLARTYVMYRKSCRCAADYDLCSTVNSQVFTGGAKEKEGPSIAARETTGEILTYGGEPIEAVYHSTCGGMTEDASNVWDWKFPYLKSRVCNYCKDSPYYTWKRSIPIPELDESLVQAGYMINGLKEIKVLERSPSERVLKLRLVGESGSVVMKGADFRKAAGYSKLPSAAFEAHKEGGSFVFLGRGSGHGVGLCQFGAKGMAEDGKTYRDILQYYYPGAILSCLKDAGDRR